jgi:hypothetical protein
LSHNILILCHSDRATYKRFSLSDNLIKG